MLGREAGMGLTVLCPASRIKLCFVQPLFAPRPLPLRMKNNTWSTDFRTLFDRCVAHYRSGTRDFATWFASEDLAFLASIGCRPREFFDFIEDHCHAGGGEPTFETALLIAAARRDYFLTIQKGKPSDRIIPPSALPAKSAALDGIVWLPRLIAKAQAKLRGEMDPDTMYGCGGDRDFSARHHVHLADLLRVVWAADGDDQKVLAYIRAVSV